MLRRESENVFICTKEVSACPPKHKVILLFYRSSIYTEELRGAEQGRNALVMSYVP